MNELTYGSDNEKGLVVDMIWANSADSHVLEPADLWTARFPRRLADRAPRSERGGQVRDPLHRRRADRPVQLNDFMDAMRPPGATDLDIRLQDLDQEGVWSQLAFPSMGFWSVNITDARAAGEVVRAWNDWAHEEVIAQDDRIFPPAIVSLADVDDAVKELERTAEMGFQAIFLPCRAPARSGVRLDMWEPLWAAAEAHGHVLGFHIGTGGENVVYRGPGGAVVNYMETTYPGMRVVSHLVAGGRPRPAPRPQGPHRRGRGRVGPGHRRPDGRGLPPARHVRRAQAVAGCPARSSAARSTRHSSTTRARCQIEGTGYRNVMWGDDYPHLEGTYGHTQETLHGLFDDAPGGTRRHHRPHVRTPLRPAGRD